MENKEKKYNPKLLLTYREHNILQTMYNNEDFCDMAFIVDSTRFPVNRAIISAASSVFKKMLLGSFQDANSKEIEIPEVGKEGFHYFVKYMYGYSIQIDALDRLDIVCDLLKLSHCYDLPNLFQALKSCISKSSLTTLQHLIFPETDDEKDQTPSVKFINTAFTYDITDLQDKIKAVVQYSSDSMKRFLNHPKFVNLTHNVLLEFLRSDHFNFEEFVILKSVLKWIEFNESTDESNCVAIHFEPNCETSQEKTKKSSEDETISTKKRKLNYGHTLVDSNIDKDGNVSNDIVTNENDVETNVNEIDTSGVKTLLHAIRWSQMSLSKFSNSMKHDPLFKKYEKFLDSSNWCKQDDDKPRKQIFCKRIEMKCKTNFEAISPPELGNWNSSIYDDEINATSHVYTIKNDRFNMKVYYFINEAKIEIKLLREKVQCIVEDCTSMTYSLVLKSRDPFESDHVLINRKNINLLFTGNSVKQKSFHPIESSCAYNSKNFRIFPGKNDCNPCDFCVPSWKDDDFRRNTKRCVDTFILSTQLLNSHPKFTQDNWYKLEAVIEYIG